MSINDHPRMMIEVLVENRDEFREVKLSHLEINWTDRLPEPPRMISIQADDDIIYRTNSTTLRIQVADELDRPSFMRLTVQMRPPQGGGWLSVRLDEPVWEDSNWTVNFHTTRDDPPGAYSFRAYVTDSDMLSSDPLEAPDLVTVINNPPGVPGINIDPVDPRTTDDLMCGIIRQAYDRDTSYMDYEYTWFLDGEEVTELNGSMVPAELTEKLQTWKVRVRAYDGEDHGPKVEATVTIRNSPPLLIRPPGPIEMLEDDPPYVIRLADHFWDPDGDQLAVNISGNETLAILVDILAGTITVHLPDDWFGTETVTLNVSDGDLVLQEELVVRVESVLDPP
ncbi:MAG: hypothetical protein KAS77_08845, partial [Thermoplasmata archaeon]|nr:hypothetical protein [Thermoplasmata archaeon]